MGPLNADAGTTKCMFQLSISVYLWNKLSKFRNKGLIKCYVERLEKHEIKIIKSVFIYKMIYWTTKQINEVLSRLSKVFFQTMCIKPKI